jgi:hypothetical protein
MLLLLGLLELLNQMDGFDALHEVKVGVLLLLNFGARAWAASAANTKKVLPCAFSLLCLCSVSVFCVVNWLSSNCVLIT